MSDLSAILALPAILMLLSVLIPADWANARAHQIRQLITGIAGIQFVMAFVIMAFYVVQMALNTNTQPFNSVIQSSGTHLIFYDGISGLMFALVSFIGWVICRFSVRYLDGEAAQGTYFRWTGFTVGAVSFMAISGNLLLFVLTWIMASLGLHHLLVFYKNRPAAQRAAWTKFTVSRIGDAALAAALILIYVEFQTLNFSEIFAAISSQADQISPRVIWAGWFLVFGAIAKSAQFPFHTWLPQTMETPTPVSALMHAGIVNAGGYLIIRTSPLVSLTPTALTALAIVGAFTACFAALIMLTQTSVKKSLAYSTIAQMGFMMLQCGLGAFSAAMLHILAHSLYKAHAFLSSGSVLEQNQAIRIIGEKRELQQVSWSKLGMLSIVVVCMFLLISSLFGINPATKPGGILLGFVLCLALISWIGQSLQSASRQLFIRTSVTGVLLCFAYCVGFLSVNKIVAPSLPTVQTSAITWLIASVVLFGFGGMFMLTKIVVSPTNFKWLNIFYVHASNGFYIEPWLRHKFGTLAKE